MSFPVEVDCPVCGGVTRIEYDSPLHGACSACRHIGVRLNTLEAAVETLTRERDEARAELRRLTDMAGDWIETDPSLRSSACIEVALDHAKVLDAEVQRLREPAHDPATCRVCQEHRRREADAVRRKGDQR